VNTEVPRVQLSSQPTSSIPAVDPAAHDETFDAFLSYSRTEKDVALLVKAALERRRLTVWLDVEAIEISTKWLAEIQRGIECSNAFVVLLSPSSLRSEVCRAELDIAQAASKRIVPVRIADLDGTRLPPAIAEIQWFDLKPDGRIEESADQLATVIRTDYEHVRMHSLLLTRLRIWSMAGSKRGYLLHGELLSRALEWLEDAANREPAPSVEHRDFIGRSHRYRSFVRRVAVMSAILGVTALGFVFFFANEGRQEAQLSASRRIAVSALNQIDSMHDQALLFSAAAYRIANTADARSALFAALNHQPDLVAFLHGHHGPIDAIAANADESLIATASDDAHTILWNTATWRPIGAPLAGHSKSVWSAAFHPNLPVLATGSVDGTIRFWDTRTGKSLFAPISAHDGYGYVTSLAFSGDGTELLSASVDKTLRRWRYPEKTMIGSPLRGHLGNVWRASYLPGDDRYVSCGDDGTVRLWDRASTVNTNPLNTGSQAQCSLAVHRSGTVAVSAGDRIFLLDTNSASPRLRAIGDIKEGLLYGAVTFMRRGTILVSARGDDIDFWDVASGARVFPTHRAETNAVRSLTYLESRDLLISGGWARPVAKVWSIDSKSLLVSALPGNGKKGTMAIAFHPLRNELVTGGWDRKLLRWDLKNGQFVSAVLTDKAAEGTLSVRFNADGSRIVTADATGDITVWDLTADGARPRVIGNHKGGAYALATPPAAGFVASGGADGMIRFWSWDGESLGKPAFHDDPVDALALSPDGNRLASGDRRGRLLLWTLTGESPRFVELAPHTNGVRSLMFTPSGNSFISSGNDGKTKLWDLDRMPPTSTELDSGAGLSVATSYSPDGRTLAVVSDDNVILMDLAGRAQRIGVIRSPHAATIAAIAFSANGSYLATSSWLGNQGLKIWEVNARQWAKQACAVANRDLTRDESTIAGVAADSICSSN
jgi:WD40 repeat protein